MGKRCLPNAVLLCSVVRRPPVGSAGRPTCGASRRSPLLSGIPRVSLVRDERGMERKQAVYCAKNISICRTSAGATGLEPATSGVTGRSWCFRPERGSAGIPGASKLSNPDAAGICGCRRELPAASCGMSAVCEVVQVGNDSVVLPCWSHVFAAFASFGLGSCRSALSRKAGPAARDAWCSRACRIV
jgi:hypothetical protein